MPRQIAYIIGNEACERFSFYGMRTILMVYMTDHLLMQKHASMSIYHFFVMGVYFLPLFGGYLSDRYLGKYQTILWLSLVYCLGHGVLALVPGTTGLYWGLALIALGSGGIKPCTSSFVGDQFSESNQSLLTRAYDYFYFTINFGAFFSSMLTPLLLVWYGPEIAFGVPGVLMALATWIFWLGRKHYVSVPPTGDKNRTHFLSIIWHGLTHRSAKRKKGSWLDAATAKYGKEKVEGVKAVLSISGVFASISAFWALYDQTGSSWVLQGQRMDRTIFGMVWEASQIQALNPIFIMLLIPVFSFVVYPALEKCGLRVTALRKIGMGMLFAGLSFVVMAGIEYLLNHGVKLNLAWQFLPYILLSSGEVLLSITGMEFSYTQAPKAMKSIVMSLFYLTFAAGNFFTAVVSAMNPFKEGVSEFLFYGGLIFLLTCVFAWMASRYQERSYVNE
jgi:POT family proton-dependent oligopeptide transporter